MSLMEHCIGTAHIFKSRILRTRNASRDEPKRLAWAAVPINGFTAVCFMRGGAPEQARERLKRMTFAEAHRPKQVEEIETYAETEKVGNTTKRVTKKRVKVREVHSRVDAGMAHLEGTTLVLDCIRGEKPRLQAIRKAFRYFKHYGGGVPWTRVKLGQLKENESFPELIGDDIDEKSIIDDDVALFLPRGDEDDEVELDHGSGIVVEGGNGESAKVGDEASLDPVTKEVFDAAVARLRELLAEDDLKQLGICQIAQIRLKAYQLYRGGKPVDEIRTEMLEKVDASALGELCNILSVERVPESVELGSIERLFSECHILGLKQGAVLAGECPTRTHIAELIRGRPEQFKDAAHCVHFLKGLRKEQIRRLLSLPENLTSNAGMGFVNTLAEGWRQARMAGIEVLKQAKGAGAERYSLAAEQSIEAAGGSLSPFDMAIECLEGSDLGEQPDSSTSDAADRARTLKRMTDRSRGIFSKIGANGYLAGASDPDMQLPSSGLQTALLAQLAPMIVQLEASLGASA